MPAPPMPTKPELPPAEPPESESSSCLGVLATMALGLAAAVTIGLPFGILSFWLTSFAIGGVMVIFFLVGIHYFLWGWWLSDLIKQDAELDEDDD
ncbi:MAG: hypothetical protein N2C14_27300 [Planctomycetales bacterium]